MAAIEHQGWIALAGALLGGSGLKIIEAWLQRPKDRRDDEAEFRNELREDVQTLRAELARVDKELDFWKDKYYALAQEFAEFKAKHR